MRKILFVCTGNTCRSSMAEGIFGDAVKKDTLLNGQFVAFSAGISAYDGDPASSSSIKVMKEEWGIDICSHRARRITGNDVETSELILAMTRSHKEAILSMFPNARHKVFTLKEFAAGVDADRNIEEYNFALDIMDPYGMSAHVYRRCALEIKNAVDKVIEKLKMIFK